MPKRNDIKKLLFDVLRLFNSEVFLCSEFIAIFAA